MSQEPVNNELEQALSPRKKDTLPYTDLEPSRWREYIDVNLGSLWLFDSREKGNGHSLDYHGNYIPQIATQLLTRYTKPGDVVLDLFLGSGTTALEAVNMGRRCVGVELKPELAAYVSSKIGEDQLDKDVFILSGDSGSEEAAAGVRGALRTIGQESAQFLVLHPPYWDIIKFSEKSEDISNAESLEEFLEGFRRVAKNGFDLLESGRFAGLIIGDKYAAKELVPLGFLTMQVMTELGFRLKSIVVKNIEGNEVAKGRTNNLWKYRALKGGFHLFKHEYVIVLQKP